MKEIKFSCPTCGTEFTINANTPSAETTASSTKRLSKAELRILALEKAGVITHGYFAVKGMEDTIARFEPDGSLVLVNDDDAVFDNDTFREIMQSGVIPNPHLFRRWIMSQMFHMLSDANKWNTTFDDVLRLKGYEYSWKMLIEEMRVQAKIFSIDAESFAERNGCFNKSTCVNTASDYISLFVTAVASAKIRRCKGRPYKKIFGKNLFLEDIEKIKASLDKSYEAIRLSDNPTDLYRSLVKFNSKRLRPRWNTKMSEAFVDAYKRAGAYFTMKNLVLFHGCTFNGSVSDEEILKGFVNAVCKGQTLFDTMMSLISNNNIDIDAKIAEWRK